MRSVVLWRRRGPALGTLALALHLSLAFRAAAGTVDVPADATAWVNGAHSAARLIDAGPASVEAVALPGRRLAGIEIRLDPSFITYWRDPGDAGVPPVFSFEGSDNLGRAEVVFPAPHDFDEDGSAAYGYADDVVFPLLVAPADAARPVTLDVTLDYAVCGRICLPAKAHLRLGLTGADASGADAVAVRQALAEAPRRRALGQPGTIRIEALRRLGPGELEVLAAAPGGTGTLFVEPPEGWFFKVTSAPAAQPGELRFLLAALDRPKDAAAPTEPLRLTLVTPQGSIDVLAPPGAVAPLDAAPSKP